MPSSRMNYGAVPGPISPISSVFPPQGHGHKARSSSIETPRKEFVRTHHSACDLRTSQLFRIHLPLQLTWGLNLLNHLIYRSLISCLWMLCCRMNGRLLVKWTNE